MIFNVKINTHNASVILHNESKPVLNCVFCVCVCVCVFSACVKECKTDREKGRSPSKVGLFSCCSVYFFIG